LVPARAGWGRRVFQIPESGETCNATKAPRPFNLGAFVAPVPSWQYSKNYSLFSYKIYDSPYCIEPDRAAK
jgi:hypothetical protein